jgi:hypothetical protein
MARLKPALANLLCGAVVLDAGDIEIDGDIYPFLKIRTRSGTYFQLFVLADEQGHQGGQLDVIVPKCL